MGWGGDDDAYAVRVPQPSRIGLTIVVRIPEAVATASIMRDTPEIEEGACASALGGL